VPLKAHNLPILLDPDQGHYHHMPGLQMYLRLEWAEDVSNRL
jgi:hypothetical protein